MTAKPRTKKTRISRIWQTILLGILSLIIGLSLYAWNARSLLGNQVPMPLGIGASVVLSGSMEPALSVGDLLVIREAKAYDTGDIVVYQSGSMAVVHRIVEMTEETVTTRGDANNAPDTPVPLDALKGRVVLVIPLLGYAVWTLKSPVGILVAIIAAILLMEASFRDERKKAASEQDAIKEEIRRLMKELEQDTE